jgi:cob(I)alamin adenosyltransferase
MNGRGRGGGPKWRTLARDGGMAVKIYTKTGDAGETSLWGQAGERRIRKDDLRVEAYGTVDEANANLGLARATLDSGRLGEQLEQIQHRLFALGADLATLNPRRQHHVTAEDVAQLEHWIDEWEATLPPLRHFVLPGGTRAASALHVARTVVRRAERRVVALYRQEPGPPEHVAFLNRLSDLLFVMARVANHQAGRGDVEAQFR